MRAPSRRQLLALGATGLFLPRLRARAAAASDRKFLFLFNAGGWDPAMVFAPVFGDGVDHGADDVAAEVGGLPFVDAPSRPSVRAFFERWAGSTCLLNGLQVPSLAHEVCTRLMMTGDSRPGFDDWPSLIAGVGASHRLLPHLLVSGPLYASRFGAASVRVGLANQIAYLTEGRAHERMDRPPSVVPGSAVEAIEEAAHRARVEAWTAAATGEDATLGEEELLALDRADRMPGVVDSLTVTNRDDLLGVLRVATRALADGLSRTAMVGFGEGGNGNWDTHNVNSDQIPMLETLFQTLDDLLTEMETTPGEVAETLLDETTVVVLSEMGRTPELNAVGGKDHWPWTSAMLIGSGIAGGRALGAWTEVLAGEPVDPVSGEVRADGEVLQPGHLGATLLALADIDPAEWIPDGGRAVIEAALA